MNIIIWGTGKFGEWAHMLFSQYNIVGYVDNDPNVINTFFHGLRVWSKDEFLKNYNNEVVVLTPKGYENEIGKWLIMHDIHNFFPFEKEAWGLHAFLKQVDLNILRNDFCCSEIYTLFPYNLLANVISEWLKAQGIKHIICKNIDEIKGKNVILTCSFAEGETRYLKKEAESTLDYSNLSLRDDLFFNPELSSFKDIYIGQRCFIVATGPSLKMKDLNTLKNNNEKCFSMNGIFWAFDKTDWRPDYYCISDHNGLFSWLNEIISMNVKEKFISDLSWIPELFDGKNEYHKWHLKSEWVKGSKPKFNVDITHGLYWARTVVCDICIPLAIYMGFKEIYLLGTDCTNDNNPAKRHFVANYNKGKVSKSQHIWVDEIMLSYQVAKEYADTHGIKIYNATRGGKLEVFPRVDFDSLFEK